MSENSNNLELAIVIDSQSMIDLECLSNWESLVRAEIKQIIKKSSYQITQSKRRKDFFQTGLLQVDIEQEDFDNLVSLRNWEELVRGKIKEIIKENYAQIDEYSSYEFRPSLLEVAINEEYYENLTRLKNWEQLFRDKIDKIIDENYDQISDIQEVYEESFLQPLPYTDYPG
ncbi:hypothetical protein [Okeania sp. SIO2B3]|uniref:hypothetical protein n=1 Tax=Okeania sp. SIO2B3 TaxID=2607784 RepID=UPI0013C1D4D2|nr:hypothetical protein [Okeania sp. SIO2B3]NET43002.1 hypothetical protein [Okeania sp. SIO2B3]